MRLESMNLEPIVGGEKNSPVRVIAVTSGKGGVGKTTISINLALAIATHGKRVTLLDADLGLAKIDVMLGLKALNNLAHVIAGGCQLQDILLTGPGGIKIVPAASGIQRMASLTAAEHAGLVYAFSTIADLTDVLIVDTAAGISDSVMRFCGASQEVIIVVCNEPSSLTDACATMKTLHEHYELSRFRIVTNMVNTTKEGQMVFKRLAAMAEEMMDVSLDLIGIIPQDSNIRKFIQRQRAIFEACPDSASALAFRKLAMTVEQWPLSENVGDKLEFFVEKMIQSRLSEKREWA